MRRESLVRTCLLVGGAFTSGMGAYHFFLPSMFRWSEYVHGSPEPIWAIFAMNAMLSFLMLWCGLATILIALKRDEFGATARFVTLGMALFWIVNAVLSGCSAATLSGPTANWISYARSHARLAFLGDPPCRRKDASIEWKFRKPIIENEL